LKIESLKIDSLKIAECRILASGAASAAPNRLFITNPIALHLELCKILRYDIPCYHSLSDSDHGSKCRAIAYSHVAMLLTRQALAALIEKGAIPIAVACLIVAKIPFIPRKLKIAAAWGLGAFLVLVIVRLALLANGD
jgi:hypothetical protein